MTQRIACIGAAGFAAAFILIDAAAPDISAQSRFRVRDERTITRTLRFGGSGARTLDVRAVHGSIRVTGSDASDVQFEVRRITRAETDADLAAAERDVTLELLDNEPRVGAIVRQPDARVCGEGRIGPRAGWRRPRYQVSVDFTIRVPRDAALRLCSINGRDIHVQDTAGDFEIDHVNGRIALANIRGSGSAETVNGAVDVSYAAAPRAASRFKTLNGRIDATFPGTLSADLTLKTFNGGLFTDFDAQLLPRPAPAAERRNGRFVYRSDESARIRIGDGGPEITLETFNGSVHVLRAAP